MRYKMLRILFLLAIYFVCHASAAQAQQKANKVTTIAYGGYQASDGEDTVAGDQLSISLSIIFSEEWAYFFRLGNGNADGKHKLPDGTSENLSSRVTTFSGGLKYQRPLDKDSKYIPFIGAGLSLQNYRYDFDYPGSEIGETSGIGYGPLAMIGMRLDIARHFLIIPSYNYDTIFISAEDGEQKIITSYGLSLALVIRF